jgi:ribonucrease Y
LDILIGLLLVAAGIALGWTVKWLTAVIKLKDSLKNKSSIMENSLNDIKDERDEIINEGRVQIEEEKELLAEEIKERRDALKEMEDQLRQRTKNLDKRADFIKNRKKEFSYWENRIQEIKDQNIEIKKTYTKNIEDKLSTTSDELKKEIIDTIIKEEEIYSQHMIRRTEQEMQRQAEVKGSHIISTALQRLPMSQIVQHEPTYLETPDQDMIGKLLVKQGRYIRLLENLLDIEIYIEDSQDGFSISSPDHIKREIAKATVDRLFREGDLRPEKIKEIIQIITKELDATMYKEANRVLNELKIKDFSEEEKQALGRLLFRYSYGQNNLYHSKEVAQLAATLALELGVDSELAKRSGLLHDIGKGYSIEGKAHVEIGAELAGKWDEHPAVINAIASHHDDEEQKYVESVLVQIADSISGARPGARRETVTSYLELVENLEKIAMEFSGVERAFAIYAGRELRIMVNSDVIDDIKANQLASDISRKIEEWANYPGKIKVTLIREMKVSTYTC